MRVLPNFWMVVWKAAQSEGVGGSSARGRAVDSKKKKKKKKREIGYFHFFFKVKLNLLHSTTS
jgi:hypothetical protein